MKFLQLKKQVTLKAKVDNKPLFSQLFELGNKATKNTSYNSKESRGEIRIVIQSYLKDSKLLATK